MGLGGGVGIGVAGRVSMRAASLPRLRACSAVVVAKRWIMRAMRPVQPV